MLIFNGITSYDKKQYRFLKIKSSYRCGEKKIILSSRPYHWKTGEHIVHRFNSRFQWLIYNRIILRNEMEIARKEDRHE